MMARLDLLLDQIRAARRYTEGLLGTIDPGDWFRMPDPGVTHVAWQVGHLAFAEYRLALERIRGRRPDDVELVPDEFLAKFGYGSVPVAEAAAYPEPAAIRAVFDRVHRRVLAEAATLPDARLDEPPVIPHPLCATKGEALAWCARHEMLHAGQIGLLRRLFGQAPTW